jgi:hypothetical protein
MAMKKIIIILSLLLLIVSAAHVSADVTWYWPWVISNNDKYVNGNESFKMQAWTGVSTNAYNVYLKNPVRPDIDVSMIYGGPYSPGIYQYSYTFATPPGPSFVGSHTLYVSNTGTIVDPTDKLVINFPEAGIEKMPFMDVTNISGGMHPTITWNSLAEADSYRFRLINPVNNAMLFDSGSIYNNSYTYGGDLFSTYDSLWIAMEARDYSGSQWIRRSRVYFAHTIPEPATMLLLGLGLTGLAGIRRKLKK